MGMRDTLEEMANSSGPLRTLSHVAPVRPAPRPHGMHSRAAQKEPR